MNEENAVRVEPPRCVTREEILEAENISLRRMNLELQIELLGNAEENLKKEEGRLRLRLQKASDELDAHKEKLRTKYKIDFSLYDIEAQTGNIIPKKG